MASRSGTGRFTAKPRKKHGRGHAKPAARHGRRKHWGRHHAAAGGASKGPSFMGLNLIDVGVGGVGALLFGAGTNFAAGKVPVAALQTGWGKLALRAALTIAGGMAAHRFLPRNISQPLIVGAGVGLGIDVLNQTVMPLLPGLHGLTGMAPLEDQLAALEIAAPGALSGLLAVDTAGGVDSPFAFNSGSALQVG